MSFIDAINFLDSFSSDIWNFKPIYFSLASIKLQSINAILFFSKERKVNRDDDLMLLLWLF